MKCIKICRRKYYKNTTFNAMNKLIKDSQRRKISNTARQKHDRLLLQWSFRISFDITDTSYRGHKATTRLHKFKNYLKDTYVTKNIYEVCEKFKFRPLLIKNSPENLGKGDTDLSFSLLNLKIK